MASETTRRLVSVERETKRIKARLETLERLWNRTIDEATQAEITEWQAATGRTFVPYFSQLGKGER